MLTVSRIGRASMSVDGPVLLVRRGCGLEVVQLGGFGGAVGLEGVEVAA